jgi:CheY-like chemotaxis protein
LRTEQQLREAQKMEAIGKLTGGLAHDFNNYIGVVIGNLDMIQENAANDPGTLSLVEAALNGATRAADLTRSLLAFARRQPLAPKVVDAAACVGDTVRLLRRTLGEQVEIGFEAEPGLWSIEVDQDQLSSSIVNLANNARDAMPRGGSLAVALRNLTVTDDAAANYPDIAPGAYVVIEVSDTGAGMAPETLASAFEPFFTTKGPGHGTGLGLSMVYGFVKQSGGHVAIYSEVGRGTVVRIYLPRAATPGAAVAPTSVGSDVLPRGAETVLIVEDNDSVRTTVARQLADLGYRTIQAASADAALAILRQAGETVDLLFTDMIMPGQMDGYALARAAVAGRPGLKVLLTSGFPGSTLDTAGRLSASFRLLSKPYRKAELARAIRFVLDAAPPAIH